MRFVTKKCPVCLCILWYIKLFYPTELHAIESQHQNIVKSCIFLNKYENFLLDIFHYLIFFFPGRYLEILQNLVSVFKLQTSDIRWRKSDLRSGYIIIQSSHRWSFESFLYFPLISSWLVSVDLQIHEQHEMQEESFLMRNGFFPHAHYCRGLSVSLGSPYSGLAL